MIEVRRYLNRYEADLARTRLESSGISAAVFVDNEGNMAPYMTYATGVRLMVAAQDVNEAEQILEEFSPIPVSLVPDDESDSDSDVHERRPQRSRIDRAYKTAIIGIFLAPGLFHIISLFMLIKSFPLTSEWSNPIMRRKFWVTLFVDFGAIVVVALLVFSLR